MRQKGFIEIAVLVVIILLTAGVIISYFFIENKKTSVFPNQTTPTSFVTKNQRKLEEDEKFKILIDGKETMINKSKLANPNNVAVNSIESYEIAPDKSKVAFLAVDGISTYFLFVSDVDGENVIYVDFADEIKWSHDSKYLAYTSPISDIGPHRFIVYEIETEVGRQLQDDELENPTKYSNFYWDNDGKTIMTEYYSYVIPGGEKIASGRKTYSVDQFK